MLLRLEEVCKRFEPSSGTRVAVDGVSLELDRGQMIGIFGPSGSGKTTLLRIAAGLQTPDQGSVSYNGDRLDRMSSAERVRYRRREIACIWTGGAWQMGLSVIDHVALPLLVDHRDHRLALRRARQALLACEVERCIDMDIDQLSDGERQRVAIARALASEPNLLIADGPASNLSMIEQESIMTLLASMARQAGVAVLIADSDASALLRADPILYLCEGKLLEDGSPGELGQVLSFPTAASRRVAADA
ncbi:MAG: ABC transporter ATP-binding protein [Solirubrobacteraceae bacterium]